MTDTEHYEARYKGRLYHARKSGQFITIDGLPVVVRSGSLSEAGARITGYPVTASKFWQRRPDPE
jgi:hypothetical protein